MNRIIKARALPALSLMLALAVPAYASVDEMTGQSINEGPSDIYDHATGETRNHLVLHQRVSERVLNTDQGMIQIPASAEIRDSRRVDDWYLPTTARVTLVFIKNKMIRVEISQ